MQLKLKPEHYGLDRLGAFSFLILLVTVFFAFSLGHDFQPLRPQLRPQNPTQHPNYWNQAEN